MFTMRRLVSLNAAVSLANGQRRVPARHNNSHAHRATSLRSHGINESDTARVWSDGVRDGAAHTRPSPNVHDNGSWSGSAAVDSANQSSPTQRVNYAAQIDNYLRHLHHHSRQMREATKSQFRRNNHVNMRFMRASSLWSLLSMLMYTLFTSIPILLVVSTFVDDVCNICSARQAHKYIRHHCETTYNVKWKEI